jgi:hypothetical protein
LANRAYVAFALYLLTFAAAILVTACTAGALGRNTA